MYLINHKKILQLKQINVEFSMFVNHLERNVLRGFLVSMIGHLSSEDTFSILEHCMTKNVYQKLVCNRVRYGDSFLVLYILGFCFYFADFDPCYRNKNQHVQQGNWADCVILFS